MDSPTYAIGGHVVRGRLVVDRAAIASTMRTWPEGEVTVTFEYGAKRSSAANRYLWGVVYKAIEAYTGQPKEQIHAEMCARFTVETISYVNPATGELIEMEVVTGTSRMRVSRFHRFVEDVRLFAAEFFGLSVPEPGEDYYQERDRADAREKRRRVA